MGDKVFPAVQTGEPTFENIINEVQDKEGSPHDQVNQDLLPRGDFQSQCHGAGSDLRGGAMECDQARHLADEMQLLSQCLAGEGQARFNKFALTIRSTAEEVADKMFARAVRHRCHGEQHRIIKGGSAAFTNRSHTQHTPPQPHPHSYSSSEPVQLEVVKTSAGSDGDAHGPFSSPKSSDEGGVISILNGEHERQVGEPVLQVGEPSTSISDDRVITSISSLGESDEAVTESRRPKSKTRRKTERKRKARAEKRQSVVSDTCSASSSTAVLATFPGDVCEAELHIGPINGTSTSSPSHADGGGVQPSIDLHSRGGDLVFHVKMETSGDRGGESDSPSKTRSHTHTPNQFNLQTQALADALVGFEHKTKCLKTRAGEWSYPLFSNWFYTNKQEETSVTAIENFRQAMPSLVDHCGSLIIEEVVTEECREDSLSLEAETKSHFLQGLTFNTPPLNPTIISKNVLLDLL